MRENEASFQDVQRYWKRVSWFLLSFIELRHYATSRAKLGNGGQETRKNQLPCPESDQESSTLLPPPCL